MRWKAQENVHASDRSPATSSYLSTPSVSFHFLLSASPFGLGAGKRQTSSKACTLMGQSGCAAQGPAQVTTGCRLEKIPSAGIFDGLRHQRVAGRFWAASGCKCPVLWSHACKLATHNTSHLQLRGRGLKYLESYRFVVEPLKVRAAHVTGREKAHRREMNNK